MSKELEVRAWEFRRDTWYHNVREVILSEPRHTEEKWPLCRIADAQAEIAGFKQYAATLSAEKAELFAALQHPSYAEENKLRAELAELHAERDGWKINAERWAVENLASLKAHVPDNHLRWYEKGYEAGKQLSELFNDSLKAQSEPVGVITRGVNGATGAYWYKLDIAHGTKLYTHPAPADKDGERYRVLRSCRGQKNDYNFAVSELDDGCLLWGNDLDAAIDAAIAKEGKP